MEDEFISTCISSYVGGYYQNNPTYRADVWKCEWRNDENDQGTSPESYFIRDIIWGPITLLQKHTEAFCIQCPSCSLASPLEVSSAWEDGKDTSLVWISTRGPPRSPSMIR